MKLRIHYEGKPYELLPGETVLAGLQRQGVQIPSFCRTGVCQTCLVRATSGRPPASSQVGIRETWAERGCFLACQCVPDEPLEVEPGDVIQTCASRVLGVEALCADVLRVELEAPGGFEYRAGQFLQLEREGGISRPFSIASLPGSDRIELHVTLRADGAMSQWLRTATGRSVTVRGAFGECFYLDNEPDRPLLLAGTGTGLAPLLGVTRAALASGHRGPIHLYHGSTHREGLYLWDELGALVEAAPQLRVFGSILPAAGASPVLPPASEGRWQLSHQAIDKLLLTDPLDSFQSRVYLCGSPELVQRLRKRVYLCGTPTARIHCDPFVF
ncbi:MAG TPA: 2Fe-2S iron-sulfur cluster binding domain-containing protein [Polyangiaceae bacterium]|jgi:NAD(P)H-flavin reductase/ferredoxin|nr:2Fe-2S iron-sulfur cluster binding domain-containing protein [Polyangiaceae bacterium]